MRSLDDLHGYQWQAIEHAYRVPKCAWWLDMGLGKTISALTLIALLLAEGKVRRCLVVAPLKVAITTWPDEIAAWEHTAGLDYVLLRPTGDEPEIAEAYDLSRQTASSLGLSAARATGIGKRAITLAEDRVRRRLVRSAARLHVVNRERLPWLVEYCGRHWPYDMIVFDESSGLRDHKSGRFKALNRVRSKITRFLELTGTPAPEGYIDLFPQIFLLDGGECLGRNITSYRERYFDYNQYTRRYKPKPSSADEIVRRIAPLITAMRAEDYLDVLQPVYTTVRVAMTKAELRQYQKFEEDLVLRLPEEVIEAETASALAQKLLQFASGAVYGPDRAYHTVHDHKIEALREVVEATQGQPIIVAYWFQSSLARLQRAFPSARKMDREGHLQSSWNRGTVPIMLLHPASGGHGLNLQQGGHYLVFFDTPYSNELYVQTVKRIARQGQTRVPFIYHLATNDTLDSDIVPRLIAKEEVHSYIYSRLRRRFYGASQKLTA
jgi:hypothetical protein